MVGEKLLQEVTLLKREAVALMLSTTMVQPAPVEQLRLAAMLVGARAAVVVNMMDLVIEETGGDREPMDGLKES